MDVQTKDSRNLCDEISGEEEKRTGIFQTTGQIQGETKTSGETEWS